MTDAERVWQWAARAQSRAAEYHRAGDFLSAARCLETARRYRALALRAGAR